MPPSVEEALDRKATALAQEAYDVLRKNLRRRVEDRAASDDPSERINQRMAIQTIRRSNLNEALTHTLEEKVHALKTMAYTCARMTQELLAEIDNDRSTLSLVALGEQPMQEEVAAGTAQGSRGC